MLKFKKVIVGLSGGVDSAVTALLLKNRGFDVHGVFMQNWDITDEQGQCSADKDFKDASIVCNKLDIPLHYVNFVKHYWNDVFSNLLKEYETGYTPNPDILCNRHIKFDYFIQYAKNSLRADAIATGHYAKTNFGCYLENYDPNKKVKLLRASCTHKDQTFFLSQVKQESLRHVMFPLGNLHKTEVKEIARENQLEQIAAKKESMGICFIGSRNFKSFISEYIEDKPGYFYNIETNKIVGEHLGIHHYTLGQKSRLPGSPKPTYIVRKNIKNNRIYVAAGWGHPALLSDLVFTSEPHWICEEPSELADNSVFECEFKFQHVQVLDKCFIFKMKSGLLVSLNKPMRALTPGQYGVFYKNSECLGSARISNIGPLKYFYEKYSKFVNSEFCNVQDENEQQIKENNNNLVNDDDEENLIKFRHVS